ncbi:MAG: response regulator transcription factor [Chloroflexi bacterium]|nr:response regulator transcription factor [Chloroflexota bacterium]
MKVLLADDDLDTLDITSYALRKEGFDIVTARNGKQALSRWEDEPTDLVVVSSTLPKINGFDVCQRIRAAQHLPVIVLLPRNDEEDILRGFRSGADDCLAKPVSVRQLSARMRRIGWRYQVRPLLTPPSVLRIADLEIDFHAHQAFKGGESIQLTPLEFRILNVLALNAGRTVSYAHLLDHTWGYGRGQATLLRAHITHLRRKLGLGYGRQAGIRSIQSVGYALVS